jgi:hypothetical protein
MRNLCFLATLLFLSGCQNYRSRKLGGSMTITLPCNAKLFDLTWKDSDFWYATRPMREGEVAETYTFQEKSIGGVPSGTVTIKECRS